MTFHERADNLHTICSQGVIVNVNVFHQYMLPSFQFLASPHSLEGGLVSYPTEFFYIFSHQWYGSKEHQQEVKAPVEVRAIPHISLLVFPVIYC